MMAALREPLKKRLFAFYLPLFIVLFVTLFPFYWMFVTSIRPDKELYNTRISPFWTFHPTLEHFRYLFRNTLFSTWAFNSILVTIVSTLVSLFCGILAGYALARLRFRGAGILGTVIFITYLVPPTLLFIPLSSEIATLGLLNTRWALIFTYPTRLIPFSTWLLMGYFKAIPRELEECARIDGASRLQAMIHIALPLGTPGILSAGIFSFTLSWNEFLYALVFATSAEVKTIPVGVVSELIRGDVFFWGPLMAAALLGSIPVALIYSFFVEYYVAGMTGAIKG